MTTALGSRVSPQTGHCHPPRSCAATTLPIGVPIVASAQPPACAVPSGAGACRTSARRGGPTASAWTRHRLGFRDTSARLLSQGHGCRGSNGDFARALRDRRRGRAGRGARRISGPSPCPPGASECRVRCSIRQDLCCPLSCSEIFGTRAQNIWARTAVYGRRSAPEPTTHAAWFGLPPLDGHIGTRNAQPQTSRRSMTLVRWTLPASLFLLMGCPGSSEDLTEAILEIEATAYDVCVIDVLDRMRCADNAGESLGF